MPAQTQFDAPAPPFQIRDGDRILLGLARQVRGRSGATEQTPGARDDLVVAGRPGAVRRQVLTAGLAQHDRVWDRATRLTGRAPVRGRSRRRLTRWRVAAACWAAACWAWSRAISDWSCGALGTARRERRLLRGAGLLEAPSALTAAVRSSRPAPGRAPPRPASSGGRWPRAWPAAARPCVGSRLRVPRDRDDRLLLLLGAPCRKSRFSSRSVKPFASSTTDIRSGRSLS